MANEKAPEQPVEQGSEKSSRKKTVVMGGAVAGVMIIEAVVVFVLVKHFTAAPATAEGAPPVHGTEGAKIEKKPQLIDLDVVKLRAQNERSQRQLTYDLDICVNVSDANKERVTEIFQRRKATVQDRLARVVRAAEPERFTEPDLRTLRKQFQAELTEIVGEDGVILGVLIPSIVSSSES